MGAKPYTADEVVEVAHDYAEQYGKVPGFDLLPIPRLLATLSQARARGEDGRVEALEAALHRIVRIAGMRGDATKGTLGDIAREALKPPAREGGWE